MGRLSAVLLVVAAVGCGPAPPEPRVGAAPSPGPPIAPPSPEPFEEVAAELGLSFTHSDGRFGEKYYSETAGSTGGLFDADGDGDLDVYLVNSMPGPGSPSGPPRSSALFEQRDGRFMDVTEASGAGVTGFGTGFAAGDRDGDGLLDFIVTCYGPDRLFRSLGGGRFEEVGAAAGVADDLWSTGAAFGDVDGDGDLDLYVAHYVDFSFEKNPFCGDRARNLRAYCRPSVFDGVPGSLFVNQGPAGRPRFRDEAAARGIAQGKDEKGFGVLLQDLDLDGDQDIYVANDGTMNRLYENDGKGQFADRSLVSGAGLNGRGIAEAGMGVAAGDVNGDAQLDLLVTNYSLESNTLYLRQAPFLYEDVSARAGITEPSYPYVGWGVELLDVDNDGDLDTAWTNGHPVDNIELFEAQLSHLQPVQLLRNDGTGTFREVVGDPAAPWRRSRDGRGLQAGDVDGDGGLDLLITTVNGPPALLRNVVADRGHWLGLVLDGPPGNRHAIGATVRVRVGGSTFIRQVRSGGSYMGQSDLRVHVGLSQHAGPVEVEVTWPGGARQTEAVAAVDRYVHVAWKPAP